MYMYVNFACPDLLFSQFYYINKTDLKGKYSLLTARAMYFYEVMFFNEEQTIKNWICIEKKNIRCEIKLFFSQEQIQLSKPKLQRPDNLSKKW